MARLWRFLKIGAISVAAVLVLIVVAVAGWVWVQMQPRDITAARAKWDANMSPEAADQAALDLVSRMTLDQKLHEMNGAGMTGMMLSFMLRQTAMPSYAGGDEGLGIPPVAFSDGPRGIACGRSQGARPASAAGAAEPGADRASAVVEKERLLRAQPGPRAS
jgi:hypothetical protein